LPFAIRESTNWDWSKLWKLLKGKGVFKQFTTSISNASLLILLDKIIRSLPKPRWAIASAGLAIFVAIATLDRYAPAFAIEHKMPGDLRAFFQCISFFGHGAGSLIAVSLIWSLDRKNKIAVPLVLGSVLTAGLVAAVVKVLVHRPRPFIDHATLSDSITFSEAVFQNSLQSFPSGHTATAFALATALSLLYRQGKPMFFLFAFLVGIQRIISQNHFPSDMLAGALIGVTSAKLVHFLVKRITAATVQNSSPAELTNSGRQQSLSGISPV